MKPSAKACYNQRHRHGINSAKTLRPPPNRLCTHVVRLCGQAFNFSLHPELGHQNPRCDEIALVTNSMLVIKPLKNQEDLANLVAKPLWTPREGALIYCGVHPPEEYEKISENLWHSLGNMNADVRYANDIVAIWKSEELPAELAPKDFIAWIKSHIDPNWPEIPTNPRPLLDYMGKPILSKSLFGSSPRRPLRETFFQSNNRLTPPISPQDRIVSPPSLSSSQVEKPVSKSTFVEFGRTLKNLRKNHIEKVLSECAPTEKQVTLAKIAWGRIFSDVKTNPPSDVKEIISEPEGIVEKGKSRLYPVNLDLIRQEIAKNSTYKANAKFRKFRTPAKK